MIRIALYVLPVVLAVYAFVDCVLDRPNTPPLAPRAVWLIAIVILPVFGPLGWLIASRLGRNDESPSRPAPRRAPDDDSEFLRDLGRRFGPDRHRDEPPS